MNSPADDDPKRVPQKRGALQTLSSPVPGGAKLQKITEDSFDDNAMATEDFIDRLPNLMSLLKGDGSDVRSNACVEIIEILLGELKTSKEQLSIVTKRLEAVENDKLSEDQFIQLLEEPVPSLHAPPVPQTPADSKSDDKPFKKSSVSRLKASIRSNQTNVAKEVVEETERKRSVVVKGITDNIHLSIHDREQSDWDNVEFIRKSINCSSAPITVYRMGRWQPMIDRSTGREMKDAKGNTIMRDGTLLKLVFPNSKAANFFVKQGKRFCRQRGSGFEKVFIRPSLSDAERAADRQARQEQWIKRNQSKINAQGNGSMTYANKMLNRD